VVECLPRKGKALSSNHSKKNRKEKHFKPGVVALISNPSTWEAEAGG
jgi:hypothetical protein